jgi:hypothetical protein
MGLSLHMVTMAVTLGLGFWAGYALRGVSAGAEMSQVRMAAAMGQANATAEAALRIEVNWRESERRVAKLQEALDVANRFIRHARADGLRARDAADGLHGAATAAAGLCGAEGGAAVDTGAAPAGPTAPAAGVVLADVLRGADDAAGELAAALDESYAAGALCERAHDALTGAKPAGAPQ